ncbi:MAG: RNA methyltransferase [Erysipelotrichia bacterium]|nr:RNA methyltransferase [Erysipelotrichia bacterium]
MNNKIVSRQNARVLHACQLKKENERVLHGEFLLEGKFALEMGLKNNLVKEIFTTKNLNISSSTITINYVDQKVMDKLSEEKTPEGLVFIAKIPQFEDKKYQKIIYLDHLNDPGNLGTIIRTALGLGVDAVYLSKDSVSPFNHKALAASKGAIFEMPIFIKEINEIKKLKKDGYQIIATSLRENAIYLGDFQSEKPFICIFGNESQGVSEELLNLADVEIKIPIQNIDSFNVAVSVGIVVYNLK